MMPWFRQNICFPEVSKKTEKGQERHNFRCFGFGSFQPPFRISGIGSLKQLSMVQSVDDLGTGFEKNVQYYEESITRNTAKLNAMIEPLMMVFLAGMVLVFLLALYLPLFQLGEWI